jgi:hypothetical protein
MILLIHVQVLDRSYVRPVAALIGITVLIAMVTTGIQYRGGREIEMGVISLSDQNQFESEPAWDANWDIDEFRHHFVTTERQQTDINKKRDQAIEHLDSEVEVNDPFP